MRFWSFIKIYEKVLEWSEHPKAVFYLCFVSFTDASFFPISPLLMFIPMVYATPGRAYRLAGLTCLASFLGGVVGYGFGFGAYEIIIEPFLNFTGDMEKYQKALLWVGDWGFWAVLIGSFLPVPFKIFTLSAGMMKMNFGIFLLATIAGRLIRFYGFACIVRWGGPKLEPFLKRFLTRISPATSNPKPLEPGD